MRGGVLRLAKTDCPLRFVWSWPEVDVTGLDPTMVVVSREPDGRAVGVDPGITDFAVTTGGAWS